MKVLIIDNFDPFLYNLVEEFEKKACEVIVYRNDTDVKTLDSVVKKFKPWLIVISSGSSPNKCGNSKEIISTYHKKIAVFGIGSGLHCIIEVFGGRVDKATDISNFAKINHDDKTIFKSIQKPFSAGIFNSLAAVDIPYSLEVTSRSSSDVVMGVRHKESFIEGIQFNPSSILTAVGSQIIDNLIKEVGKK